MTPTDRDRSRDLDALLEALTAVPGLSGHESDMADCLTEQLGPLVDSHWRDPMGNWLGRRAPRPAPATGAAPAPRLLLSAHMDAIGFMVTFVLSLFSGYPVAWLLGEGRRPSQATPR